jgi:small subunit ribosomal protein S9
VSEATEATEATETPADSGRRWYATGKRKTSVARVYMKPGSGKVTVNGRDALAYFERETLVMMFREPLEITKTGTTFDINCRTHGGGKSGQAGALRHGISKALLVYEADLRGTLKAQGMLTRDARIKERKKYGQRGARARFQFSKR